jgi:hypothetical protein
MLKEGTHTPYMESLFDSKINNSVGALEAVLTFGNTLDLVQIGGMLYSRNIQKDAKAFLGRFYVDFKTKKCHLCSRPIINPDESIFCSRLLHESFDRGCYRYTCKDCLDEKDWQMSKENILFRCAYCRKESFITNIERLKENPNSFLEKEIYWYHWRGKRQYVRAKITHYDRIRKQHKILLC